MMCQEEIHGCDAVFGSVRVSVCTYSGFLKQGYVDGELIYNHESWIMN